MARRGRQIGAQAPATPAPVVLASPIRILAHHGFIDDDGKHRRWTPGQVVADPDTIALLIDRGARHEPE